MKTYVSLIKGSLLFAIILLSPGYLFSQSNIIDKNKMVTVEELNNMAPESRWEVIDNPNDYIIVNGADLTKIQVSYQEFQNLSAADQQNIVDNPHKYRIYNADGETLVVRISDINNGYDVSVQEESILKELMKGVKIVTQAELGELSSREQQYILSHPNEYRVVN